MATRSFRDRFYSPAVARALTSPSGILSLGAGAAIGLLATVGTGGLIVPVAAIVGGALGYGGRVALAIPGKDKAERIDPLGVKEPWRHAVKDAMQARDRFAEAVKSFQPGPLQDEMATMADQFDEAVAECWRVAKQGQVVTDARRRIDDREVNWEYQQAVHAVRTAQPTETQARTLAALESQLATAARMDALVAGTRDQLALINARLDESVTRAVELSVSNRLADAADLEDDVGAIVDDLESLRMAIEDVDRIDAGGAAPAEAPGARPAASLPPPPTNTRRPGSSRRPPPPASEQGGQSQASPGS